MKALVENNLKNKQTNKQRKEKEKKRTCTDLNHWKIEEHFSIKWRDKMAKITRVSEWWWFATEHRKEKKDRLVNFILPFFLCTQLYIEEETPGNKAGTLGCLYAVT